jgi:biopolymer transport protein ExbD/biopolymer transport protein TolR
VATSKVKHKASGVNSEINVTPMADIMLVLLIIFMITTPLLQKGITVNLPKGRNVIKMPEAENREALVVGMDRTMRLYLGNVPQDAANLKDGLITAMEVRQQDRVFLKCDQGVVYEKVTETLDLIREVGFEQIGLLVDKQKI